MALKRFVIDPNSLGDICIRKEWGMYDHKETLTDEELVKVLTGQDRCSTVSTQDHPEFAQLRNTLDELGYIETERGWWNGDRVLKSFSLNGAVFKKGEKFHCGAAIKYTVEYKLKGK